MIKKVNKKKAGRPARHSSALPPPRWGIEDDGTLTKEYESSRFDCDRMAEELELSPLEVDQFMRNGRDDDSW